MTKINRTVYRDYTSSENLGKRVIIGEPMPRVKYTVDLFEEFIKQGHNQ